MEHVLVLIKPEGVQRAIVGEIINHFNKPSLKIVALKMVKPSVALVKKHYILLKNKFFYAQIADHLTGKFHQGAPVVAMIIQGKGSVKKCRLIAGATNPKEADPKSIRGKYGRIKNGLFENIVHVSSSPEEAKREIALWFKKSEIIN